MATNAIFTFTICPDCDTPITRLGHDCGEWEVTLTGESYSKRDIACSRCAKDLGRLYAKRTMMISGYYFCPTCATEFIGGAEAEAEAEADEAGENQK